MTMLPSLGSWHLHDFAWSPFEHDEAVFAQGWALHRISAGSPCISSSEINFVCHGGLGRCAVFLRELCEKFVCVLITGMQAGLCLILKTGSRASLARYVCIYRTPTLSGVYFAIQASENFSSPWWEVGKGAAEELAGEWRRHQRPAGRSSPHHPTARSAHDLPAPGCGARRLPPSHPRCQGISQAAGSGKTGTGAPGRLHLALSAPRTRSGAALASRFGPAVKGPSSGGPALAALQFPSISAPPLARTPASPAASLPAPPTRPQVFTFRPRTARLCCVRRSLRLRRRWRPRLVQETGRGRHASHTRLPAPARPARARPAATTLPG